MGPKQNCISLTKEVEITSLSREKATQRSRVGRYVAYDGFFADLMTPEYKLTAFCTVTPTIQK